MKPLLFLIVLMFIAKGQSQGTDPSRPDQNVLRQQGQLFTVRMVLGEPVKIFVVGREEARISPSDLNLTVRRINPYPGEVLAVSRVDDHFVVTAPDEMKKAGDIEVTAKHKGKSETIRFKLDNKVH